MFVLWVFVGALGFNLGILTEQGSLRCRDYAGSKIADNSDLILSEIGIGLGFESDLKVRTRSLHTYYGSFHRGPRTLNPKPLTALTLSLVHHEGLAGLDLRSAASSLNIP